MLGKASASTSCMAVARAKFEPLALHCVTFWCVALGPAAYARSQIESYVATTVEEHVFKSTWAVSRLKLVKGNPNLLLHLRLLAVGQVSVEAAEKFGPTKLKRFHWTWRHMYQDIAAVFNMPLR